MNDADFFNDDASAFSDDDASVKNMGPGARRAISGRPAGPKELTDEQAGVSTPPERAPDVLTPAGPASRLMPATPQNALPAHALPDPLSRAIVEGVAAEGATRALAAGARAAAPYAKAALSKAPEIAGKVMHAAHAPVTFVLEKAAALARGAKPAAEGAARFAPAMTAAEARAAIDAATAGGAVTRGAAVMNLIKAGTPRAVALAGAAEAASK